MPASSGLSPERAKQLKDEDWSHAEIAQEYHLTASGVSQILRKGGYTRSTRFSHKGAIPWTVTKEHHQDKVAKYLRYLSTDAQGGRLSESDAVHDDYVNTALNWAHGLLDKGQDIFYDREEGWIIDDAVTDNWHLKRVVQRVITANVKKL
jgi:hypothetical protein